MDLEQQKRELAFQYVNKRLSDMEKREVFELILTDDAFRQYLKEEVTLREKMKILRSEMDASYKTNLLAVIKRRAAEEERSELPETKRKEPAWLKWSEWTLKQTLPPIIYPVMKILQRSVFV